jgi:hypothetical protein
MEKDLTILKKILKDLHYSETYIEVLMKHIIKNFNESDLDSFTPNFIYNSLVYDEGKETARKISNYFVEIKEFGTYTPITHNERY